MSRLCCLFIINKRNIHFLIRGIRTTALQFAQCYQIGIRWIEGNEFFFSRIYNKRLGPVKQGDINIAGIFLPQQIQIRLFGFINCSGSI